MSDSEGSNVRPGAESQSAQYQQAGYARDQCQWDSEQHRGWGPAARWQRVEATAVRSWGQVGARDAWGDTLALFCLGVQKYKALLVLAEQLGYGHIFDSRGHRSRTVFSGDHGVQWDRHRRGPAARSSAQVPPPWMWLMCLTPASGRPLRCSVGPPR